MPYALRHSHYMCREGMAQTQQSQGLFLGPLTKAGLPTGGLHLPYALYQPAEGGVPVLQ